MNNNGLQRLKQITKNRVESIKLLEAALNKDEFINYFCLYFDKDKLLEEFDFSQFQEQLSENEFQELYRINYYTKKLWDVLSKENFSAKDAKEPIIWLSITLQAIENDVIKPYYLAFIDKSKDGKKNITDALMLARQGNDDKLFDISRAILRRTFGNINERRGKGVYQDIPFSIAWWNTFISKESSKATSLSEKDIFKYFLNHRDHYNRLIQNMNGKLTTIADKNIRDALMLYVINKETTGKDFGNIMKKIGIESSWRMMGALSVNENHRIIKRIT